MIKLVSDTTLNEFVSDTTLNDKACQWYNYDSLSVIQLSMTKFISDTTLNDSLSVIQL